MAARKPHRDRKQTRRGGTRPQPGFEEPAAPEATNRDHPKRAGERRSAASAGAVRRDAASEQAGQRRTKDASRRSPGAQRRSTNFTHDAASPSGKRSGSKQSRYPAAAEAVTGSDSAAAPLSVPDQAGPGDAPDVPKLYDPNFSAASESRSGGNAGSNRTDAREPAGEERASNRRTPRTVGDIMSSNLQVATPDSEVRAVARMMEDRDVGAIPIVENTDTMRPAGIVTDRDIAIRIVAKGQDPYTLPISACMSANPLTVHPEDSIQECVDRMSEAKLRRCLVVDREGRLVGIVAQADIALEAPDDQTDQLVQEVSEDAGLHGKGMYH
jgi:CBS domain-containing protein